MCKYMCNWNNNNQPDHKHVFAKETQGIAHKFMYKYREFISVCIKSVPITVLNVPADQQHNVIL